MRADGQECRSQTELDGSLLKMPELNCSAETKWPAILLFGMPGVGKGTQGTLLGTMRGMRHISTGALFRALDPNSDDGREVFARIDRGELVSDESAIRIWRNSITQQIAAQTFCPDQQVLLLDGIPRSRPQCELLANHVDVLAVLHLESRHDDLLIDRLMQRGQGRADDSDASIIRRRFEIYRATTQPVLDYYPSHLVHSIDPIGSVMQVKQRLLDVVIPVLYARGILLSEPEAARSTSVA